MNSSYARHGYDEVFEAIIAAFRPLQAVELGVLEGYSAIAIAKGLKRNAEQHGIRGHLDGYDLWERYPHRHATLEDTWRRVEEAGVQPYVALHAQDAFTVHQDYAPRSVQFLHVDLSNTGAIVKDILDLWDPLMDTGSIVCFEGGSDERDAVAWMQQYQASSIKREIETNPILNAKYVYGTYVQYPSLTCCLKKRH